MLRILDMLPRCVAFHVYARDFSDVAKRFSAHIFSPRHVYDREMLSSRHVLNCQSWLDAKMLSWGTITQTDCMNSASMFNWQLRLFGLLPNLYSKTWTSFLFTLSNQPYELLLFEPFSYLEPSKKTITFLIILLRELVSLPILTLRVFLLVHGRRLGLNAPSLRTISERRLTSFH